MGIKVFELVLRNSFQALWKDVVSKIGTTDDVIPDIFPDLPATGDFETNWQAIGEDWKRMATGNTQDDLTFLLQFPTASHHLPAMSFEVGTEQEEEFVTGFIEEAYDDASGKWLRRVGGLFTKTYAIGAYSYSPDTTIYLYSFIKYGLLLFRNSIQGQQEMDVDVSNIQTAARPMVVLTQYGPEPVYARYVDVTAEGMLDSAIERYDKVKRVISAVSEEHDQGHWANAITG